MSRALKQICLAGIVVAFLFASFASGQGPTMREDVRQDLDLAVKLFKQAEFEKAAEALDRVIEKSPSSQEALVLRERAGINILAKMLRDPRLGPNAQNILHKASEEAARVQRDPQTIRKLIDDMGSSDKVVRWQAIRHLTAVGPFAVPYLLDHALGDEVNSTASRKVGALIVLRDMASAGTPPLIVAARNAGAADAMHIVRILAQNRDARAMALFASIANNNRVPDYLRNAARQALVSLAIPAAKMQKDEGDKIEIPSTSDICMEVALRYYYADPRIVEITPPHERVLWQWNAEGTNWSEKLVFKEVPQYAYPNILAEDTLLAGMDNQDTSSELLELYICNNYMQLDAAIDQSDERATSLEAVHGINESLGADYIYPALSRAIEDNNTALAIRCIEALRNIGDSRAPKSENSLISALSYPDKLVRAMAAETLVHISPVGQLGGCQEVVSVLAAGMGAQAREIVVVLTAKSSLAEELSKEIDSWNMVPKVFDDPATVLGRIKAEVPPTNLLILDTRIQGISIPVVIQSIRQDARSSELPVILLAPQQDVEKFQSLYGKMVAAVIPVPPESNALSTARESALASAREALRAADIRENTELLRRVLQTAASLPQETHYKAGVLGTSASNLLRSYPDDIRILALQTIEALPAPLLCNRVYTVFVDANEAILVRQAAGRALLEVLVTGGDLSNSQRKSLREMTHHEDLTLQQCAIHALAVAAAPQAERQGYLSSVGAIAQ